MSRPIPEMPRVIGNDGHMPESGKWRYDAFWLNESRFASAELQYSRFVWTGEDGARHCEIRNLRILSFECWDRTGNIVDPGFLERNILQNQMMNWFWDYDSSRASYLEINLESAKS